MKKTTKILLVLAAVVAMTIGAVSTVMAAETYPVVDSSTWECTDGWYAKDTEGNQIVTGWAVDEVGHYFYFENKKALENTFLTWKGEVYYFGKDCIMCEGWVKFLANDDRDVEALLSIDQDGYAANEALFGDDATNPYGKVVWCYFQKGGAAAFNEWVNAYGLWYYFEDVVMICDNYAYYVAEDNAFFGFSGDGNMHVGWIQAKASQYYERPFQADYKCWLYYNKDGSLVDDGWKKIDGVWYFFVANAANSKFSKDVYEVPTGVPVLLTNTFLSSNDDENLYDEKSNDEKFFYFDANGALQTGVVTISTKVSNSLAKFFACDANKDFRSSKSRTFRFDGDGSMITGEKDNVYYFADNGNAFVADDRTYGYNSETKVTDNDIETKLATGTKGEKMFNTFVVNYNSDGSFKNINYFDARGNKVKNGVVTIGSTTIAFDKDGNAMFNNSPEKGVYVGGRYYYFSNEFGTVEIVTNDGVKTIPGCSTRKLSTVSGSGIFPE